MKTENKNTIYTIGHSVHKIDVFIELLKSFRIDTLADVRRIAASAKHPQFGKQILSTSLHNTGINYIHFPDLGAKFDGRYPSYSTYMETDLFKNEVVRLSGLAATQTVAYMCAEANWRHCHRSKISQYLSQQGWNVLHIVAVGRSEAHPVNELRQGSLFS